MFIIILYNASHILAGWQSGHAAACKAVYSGSIPDSASKISRHFFIKTYNEDYKSVPINKPEWWNW